jgi:cysteinyl-tRNA synthetase
MGNTKFDLCVVDYSHGGSDETRFTAAQIAGLKNSPGGAKLVLSYLSIGEAEDYRSYWHKEWDADHDGNPDPGAPAWLGPSNPDWPGNYKVQYWQPEWQAIVYNCLDKVVEAGFDGAYLDIIDAYEYWGPGGESGLERPTAEQEMVDFVKAIAAHARAADTAFGIFPQNGEALAGHADYVQAVTGIGCEDVWYDGDDPQPAGHTQAVTSSLDAFCQAGRLVLVIDYVRQPQLIDDFYAKARAKSYVPYATVRDLDSLSVNPGHEPD